MPPRPLRILLLLAVSASADDLFLKTGGPAFAKDVMVLREEGGKVYYLDKTLKERTFDKAMIGRIEKKRCDLHEFVERSDAAQDADAVAGLAKWAEKRKFGKEVVHALWERALGLDPDHEESNTVLGRVRHEGEWMTPEERAARIAAAEEAAQLAKGLVRWKDQWVSPEDKAQLEKGLIKHEGKWRTEAEVKEAQGFVQYEGKWVKREDLEVLQLVGPARQESGLGNEMQLHQTEHYAIMGDLAPAELVQLGEAMEKLWLEWIRVFPDAEKSDILRGKHRLYVFRKSGPYQRFVRERYRRQKETEKWSDLFAKEEEARMNLRLRETSFWDVQPYPESAHVMMPDPFEGLRAHCVHFGANILASRHGRVRFPTWWLNEGLAYYFELRVTGSIQTFNTNVGGGGYANAAGLETGQNDPWLDATKWQELLAGLVRTNRDPSLDQMKGKDLFSSKNKLAVPDLAKGLSVVTFLVQDDAKKFAAFYADAKEGSGQPVEREVAAFLKHYGNYGAVEEAWRKYAQNGFRLAR